MSKLFKRSEPLEKLKKNHIFFFLEIFFKEKNAKKKCYHLSFLILGGHNETRALQSNTFQNSGVVVRA